MSERYEGGSAGYYNIPGFHSVAFSGLGQLGLMAQDSLRKAAVSAYRKFQGNSGGWYFIDVFVYAMEMEGDNRPI